jgi:Skp family chaperone for outer membrane proteins
VAGLATLAAVVSWSVRGWAQAPTAPHPLQTRIGLLNMVQVLKNYKKFQAMEQSIKKRAEELEKTLVPYQNELNAIRTAYNDAKNPPSQAERERLEVRMKQKTLELQLKEEEAKKELIKMNGEAAVTIYKEVEDAVNLYARSNNLELVMFYNDAVTAEDYYHPANLQRKLTQPAAVMPLFVAPGMDISNAIVTNLNAKYAPSAAAPAAPAAPRN